MQGPHLPLVSAVRARAGRRPGPGRRCASRTAPVCWGPWTPLARRKPAASVRLSVGPRLASGCIWRRCRPRGPYRAPEQRAARPGFAGFLPSTLALNTCSGGELAGPHGPPTRPPRGAACVPPAACGPGVPLGRCCLRRRPRSSDGGEEAANTPGRAAALGAPAAPRRLLRRRGFLRARGGPASPHCA